MATLPETTSPTDRATPLVTMSARSARRRSGSGGGRPGGASWAITSSRMSGGANASRALPKAPLWSGRLVVGAIVTRSAWLDGISWRHTAASPRRRTMTAVSPVSSASRRSTGSAVRISSSAVTFAPLPMISRGPSR